MRRQVVWVKLMPLVLVIAAFFGLAMTIAACSTTNTIACGTGSVDCAGTCTVLARDPENCGACGTKCAAGQSCSAGMCVGGASTSCPNGTSKCGDACVATANDPANCGACGTKCATNEVCSTGKCASTCGATLTQCGMSCVDTKNDGLNCGMCGKACPMGQVCGNGSCGYSCMQGLTICMSNQMNPPPQPPIDAGSDADPDASMEASVMDSGVMTDAGQGAPICVDLQNNDRHCGACGNFCYGNQKCNAGKCELCTLCGGKCLDVANDDNNCTGCGITCGYDGGATSCKNNYCCKQKINAVYLQDDFRDASKNWTLGTQWAIGPAVISTGCSGGNDPPNDHTNRGDKGLAGMVIGGCQGTAIHSAYYLTSATFDTSNATKVVASWWRWLHSDYTPYQLNTVEVYDGMSWVPIFATGGTSTHDTQWVHQQFDVTAYKNAQMQIRFGTSTTSGVFNEAGWSLDDVLVADEDCAP